MTIVPICLGLLSLLSHRDAVSHIMTGDSMNAQTDSSSLSCDGSEASTAETVNGLDDILDRYTFTCDPEFCLKLRRSVGSISLRANRYFNGRVDRWAFVVKPADEAKHKWIHKLGIEPAYERASLSTSKIGLWGFLRVQAVGTFDWDTREFGVQWRVTSRWSRGQGKLGRKEKWRRKELPAVQLHPHWRMDLFMPEVEGTLGGGGGRRDQSVHVEKGHCHLSIPKLEVLLDLNNIPDTKADLATLVRRVTRRPQKVSIQKPLPISESEPARIAAATPHSSTIEREHKQTEAADLQQSTADTFRTRASPQRHINWKDNPRQQFEATHAILEEPRESLHQEHTGGPFQKLELMWKQMTGNLKRQ